MSQRAGWYDDPENPENLRYFDGVIWTGNVVPKVSPTAAQSTIGRAEQPAQRARGGQPGPPTQAGQPGGPGRGAPDVVPQDSPASRWQPDPSRQPDPSWQPDPSRPPESLYAPQPWSAPPAGHGITLGTKTTPDGEPLSGWGLRVWARLIDAVITGIATAVLGAKFVAGYAAWFGNYVQKAVQDAERGVQTPMDMAAIQAEVAQYVIPLVLIGILVATVYETFFLVRWGATPGKMVAGIRVRRRADPGPLTLRDALTRQALVVGSNLLGFVPVVSLLTSGLLLLDGLWPLWDDKRQALHDKVAQTNVVLRRRR